ncbi:MAG: RNA methyltransferase [Clostridia bacterium]|nr:RNA methyltransferase [Clostridia bacterium]
MVITSNTNNQIALLRKLHTDKKYRVAEGKYCIEGERLVKEAIRFGKQILAIYVAESAQGKFAFDTNCPTVVVADNVFASISQTVNSQGVIAVVALPTANLCAPQGKCLIVENLQDPGNLGTLLRTAVATGYNDVYLCNSTDVYAPKVIRSAMSAHFALNLHFGTISQVFDVVSPVCQIVCADMDGTNVFDFVATKPVALVLGNEGNGLTQFAKQNCHNVVSLPMKNNLESLNVAVAGSVLMYLL